MLTSSHGARCRGGRLPQLLVFLLHNVELACKILNGWAAGRPTGRRSRALCCVLKCGAMQWLRTHIPDDFWHKVHTEFCDINLRRRVELTAINRSKGLSDQKSFMKHVSYAGAIHVPPDFPEELLSWTDKKSGERFLDPRNAIYCDVFKAVWPNVRFSNAETVGDLIEAVLGLTWAMKAREETLSPGAEDFVQLLEQAILCVYSLQTWYPGPERA